MVLSAMDNWSGCGIVLAVTFVPVAYGSVSNGQLEEIS
jgi:hypothetical protein